MAESKKDEPQAPPDPGWPEHKVKVEMEKKPVIQPDGHVTLSQEDIDARV
jgi:hypothetical protein